MSACVFCQVILREINSAIIGENELAVAFLDIRPVNTGHTLVIPRRCVPSFTELREREVTAVFQLIQQVGTALKSALPDGAGLTLSAADGKAADQEVAHAHFHLIPRLMEDGFGWRRFGASASPASLAETASLIRASMTNPHAES